MARTAFAASEPVAAPLNAMRPDAAAWTVTSDDADASPINPIVAAAFDLSAPDPDALPENPSEPLSSIFAASDATAEPENVSDADMLAV